jgi:hypothetical protein
MVNHEKVNVHFHDHYYHLEFHFDDDNNDPINVDYEFFQSNFENKNIVDEKKKNDFDLFFLLLLILYNE